MLCDSRADVEAHWWGWAARHGISWPTLSELMHGRRSVDLIDAVAPELDAEAEAAEIELAQAADTHGTVALPGAVELVASLPSPTWAVVTSGSRELALSRLRSVGIEPPPILIAAEDVAAGKPDPSGYLLAAERLGVEPGRCLVVEDAPAGIAAGRAAGATVLALTTTHPAVELGAADAIAASLAAVGLLPGDGVDLRFSL